MSASSLRDRAGWKTLAGCGVLATSTLGSPREAIACHDDPEPAEASYESSSVVGVSFGVAFGRGVRFSYGLDLRWTSGRRAIVLRFEGRGLTSARAVLAGHALTRDGGLGGEAGLALHSSHGDSNIGRALALHVAGGPHAGSSAAVQAQASFPFYGDLRNYEGSLSVVLVPGEWSLPCSGGRRLRDGDSAVLPGVAALDDTSCGALAHAWIEDARAEYASIWAFERMAAELRAAGAPPALVAAARRAALDEARHVDLCTRLAGAPFSLLPLDDRYAAPRWRQRSAAALTTLAREAWIDGCLGEGIAAAQAATAARSARGGAAAAQATISVDERRHAELAWAILDWAWREGDARVRDAVVETTREEPALPEPPTEAGDPEQLTAGGRLGAAAARAAAERETEQAVARVRGLIG